MGAVEIVKYEIEYDASTWFPVPESFPSGRFADEDAWVRNLIGDFEAELGTLDDDARAAVVELAALARSRRTALASECLLFCPRSVPAFGVANIFVGEHDEERLDLASEAGNDDRAQLPPTLVEFVTEHLGAGQRAAVVVPSSELDISGGRFNYVFDAAGVVVAVSATADSARDAGYMAPFLDELVRGIRLEAG